MLPRRSQAVSLRRPTEASSSVTPTTLRPIGGLRMPSSVRLLCVSPSLIEQVWPHVRGLLKRASEKTGMGDFGQQEREVLSGLQLLWLASNGRTIEAATTTQIVN